MPFMEWEGPHWACLSVATGLALIALALALWRRTRRASRWVAIASIVASIPPVLLASLLGGVLSGLFSVATVPVLIAVVAICVRKDREARDTF